MISSLKNHLIDATKNMETSTKTGEQDLKNCNKNYLPIHTNSNISMKWKYIWQTVNIQKEGQKIDILSIQQNTRNYTVKQTRKSVSLRFWMASSHSVDGEDNERFRRNPTIIPISPTTKANITEKPGSLFLYLRLFSRSCRKRKGRQIVKKVSSPILLNCILGQIILTNIYPFSW